MNLWTFIVSREIAVFQAEASSVKTFQDVIEAECVTHGLKVDICDDGTPQPDRDLDAETLLVKL